MPTETVHKQGNLRGVKASLQTQDGKDLGTTYCVWYPLYDAETADRLDLTEEQRETPGLCFDIEGDDLETLVALLQTLRDATPDVWVQEEYEETNDAPNSD